MWIAKESMKCDYISRPIQISGVNGWFYFSTIRNISDYSPNKDQTLNLN